MIDRAILIGSGLVLLGGGIYGAIWREGFGVTGLVCAGIGGLILAAGVFLPCRIVRKLTGWF